MPGTFSKDARPRRPGAYTNYEAAQQTVVPVATGSIVAMPISHDWGPFLEGRQIGSWGEFLALYGSSDTAGARAVRRAFIGEGLPGRAGAGGVLVYRMGVATGGGSAARATRVLNNDAGTPAAMLTLTALYHGTLGNRLTATVQTNSADNTKADILLKLDGRTVETYTWDKTDAAGVAAQINQFSNWVTALAGDDTANLANVSNSAFAGGADGATLTGTEWSATMGALEFERFGVFSTPNLTDDTIVTALRAWITSRNLAGQRFLAIIGGAGGDTLTLANARSRTANNPDIVNVGGFSVVEEDTGLTLSPAEVAPRIAGIFASRGMNRSATFARLAGLRLVVPPTSGEVDQAFDAGTLVLSRDSYAAAPVRIEKALTTYTTMTDDERPYRVFRNPKFLLTMHALEQGITEAAESPGTIGELGVNDKTRAALVADAAARLRAMEDQQIIQSGWTVGVDQDPPPSDDDEFVALRYSLRFMRSVEQVYSTIVVA